MNLSVLTPHKKIVDGEKADEIFAPGFRGQLNIFDLHAGLVTTLETGVLKWKTGGQWKTAAISKGLLEVHDDHVTVLADVSELASDIDPKRARQAGETARKKLEDGGLDDQHFRKYELKLKRSMARLNASGEESL